MAGQNPLSLLIVNATDEA
jgi:hypothetical protein